MHIIQTNETIREIYMFDTIFSRKENNNHSASPRTQGASPSIKGSASETASILKALDRSQAVIHFKTDGTILTANENFLNAMGYRLDEIKGQHHRIFVPADYAQSVEYKDFWQRLANGEFQAAEYKRIAKGGKYIWIQATYNPILDKNGNVVKIVKYATDITQQTLEAADYHGQINAINRVQAVIQFDLEGNILDANENFLKTVGYSLAEIKGQHHRMFVDSEYSMSNEYHNFWKSLASGKSHAAQYKRFGKNGKEVWIQASYNPILDPDGKPFKVVKYATDITEEILQNADFKGQLEAIHKSQAVIEFNLDGTIKTANENFLNTVGYSLEEIKGQHHRLFVDDAFANSTEYKRFWDALSRGAYQAGEYKRVSKGGREVWIQASYNPIFDPDGNPFKVVKYATDITDQVHARDEAARVGEIMDTNLEKILSTVGEASSQMSAAANASTHTLQTVQSVAAASEEFQASTQEIARSMEASRGEVSKAMDEANSADQSTRQLTEAAGSMNNIVEVIQDIAGKINLLALNATIESARAGEAGKGFAVVASEVKSLANQVANATAQISEEIQGMQNISSDVVTRLEGIRGAVVSVESSVTSVASAVEEQVATTREITSGMQTAATAVDDINSNLGTISNSVETANTYAREGSEMYRSLKAS
jgi:methyl-accepting chemotaxis protein